MTRDLRSRLANQQEEVTTAVSAMASGDIDVQALYLDFVAANPGQRLLDQVLLGEFPAEFFEGPAGQLQMMIIQDAMQARTNFMNMMTNMMKKNDEAAGSIIGNMR